MSGIFLDTTASRTVCDLATNTLVTRAYKGDGEPDDFSEALLAIERDAYVFADAHD